MEGKRLKQVVNQLRKSLDNWDYSDAIKNSLDEAQTRDFLIHHFFENILIYNKMKDYSHEIVADVGGKRGRKVDMAINLGTKKPLILVECKSATKALTDNNFRQLNDYCHNLPTTKIGILTNGIIYKFYTQNQKENNNLFTEPFFTFDLNNYGTSDLEMLALFNRETIEIKDILEEASDIYFLNQFDEALYLCLKTPSEVFLKDVYYRMGGKSANKKALESIAELINSTSLKTAVDRVIQAEISSSNSGVITTEEELKIYSVIKTILAMAQKIKGADLERIGYRDLKGSFTLIVDDNQNKKICSIVLKDAVKRITINGKEHKLKDSSVSSLTTLKKELVKSAITCLN
jgi:hypothetical protein